MVPFATVLWVTAFTQDFSVNEAVIGFLVGLFTAAGSIVLAIVLWNAGRKPWLGIFLAVLLVFDLAWYPIARIANFPTKPYARADIAFNTERPPTIDCSGHWGGSWDDEKQELTETITLVLEQNGNEVTGTITSERGRQFRILDGKVSGDQLNLYYNVTGTEWGLPGGGGSLVGRLKGDSISGTWYAHETPQRGWSRDGPWRASLRSE
ncbi:MAG: hypothetical protein AAF333_02650 [Planctomycetota bacterium]